MVRGKGGIQPCCRLVPSKIAGSALNQAWSAAPTGRPELEQDESCQFRIGDSCKIRYEHGIPIWEHEARRRFDRELPGRRNLATDEHRLTRMRRNKALARVYRMEKYRYSTEEAPVSTNHQHPPEECTRWRFVLLLNGCHSIIERLTRMLGGVARALRGRPPN
jgi:hypothetical protein